MISDDERREVAARLRKQQAEQFPPPEVAYDVSPSITTWERLGGIALDPETWAECDRLKSRDNRAQAVRSVIAGRLADLIEPSCDRDALLALADEMFEDATGLALISQLEKNEELQDLQSTMAKALMDYARRIREACGEVG